MRYIPINELQPGMRLSFDLYASNGVRLFVHGHMLDPEAVEYIKATGVFSVYIDENANDNLKVNPIIEPKLRADMMGHIKKKNIEQCSRDAMIVYKCIMNYSDLPLDYRDSYVAEDTYLAHSISVAITAGLIGLRMGLSYKEIDELILAGLLHDIGMEEIDPEILMKSGRLSQSDYITIKLHPNYSYNTIKDVREISEDVKLGILHHHENENGSGYPDMLEGNKIPMYARILHVADTYEALTAKRPYKDPYTPFEAMEYIRGGVDVLFYGPAVKALDDVTPVFPMGSPVKMSNGEHGIVYSNTRENRFRPIVLLDNGKLFNLAKPSNSGIAVTSLLEHADFSVQDIDKNRNGMIRGRQTYRVMCVDDQKTNLSMLREILEDYYDLTLLKSGEQALKYLENNSCPDLILMDINMPEMDGLEATRRIQEKTGNMVPILFVSSNHDRETVLACRNLNCVGYIVRPYNPVYIKAEIKRILTGEEA